MPTPPSVEFDCPWCRYRIAVAQSDKDAVRKAGNKKRVLLIRVTCPGCERLIVRTMLDPDRK